MKKVTKNLLRKKLEEKLTHETKIPEAEILREEIPEIVMTAYTYSYSYSWITNFTQVHHSQKVKKYRKSYKRRKYQTQS